MAHAGGDALDGFRWRNRVVVVFANSHDDEAMNRQQRVLRNARADLLDRDVVVITAGDDRVEIDGVRSEAPNAERLRRVHGVPPGSFQVLLIGKDGGVKLRAAEPIAIDELFALIDAMPMRRREIHERAGATDG